jgi:hypothetical protein
MEQEMTGKLEKVVKTRNKRVKSNLKRLSLNPSTGGNLVGGVCVIEPGLQGVLRRYCQETFVEDVNRCLETGSAAGLNSWTTCLDMWATRSCHRRMRKAGTPLDPTYDTDAYDSDDSFEPAYPEEKGRGTNFESYLRRGDHLLAMSCLRHDTRVATRGTKTLKGILDNLESLHHSSIPFVEGLTVELLEFQRQSVQWALERETTPGGIQSFLWGKLPSVAEPVQDLYYNPILERFRRDKPRLVRGGIIAEEMGLGKTVISLALVSLSWIF